MSYSYMKHHYGDNCFYGDTDYKRYARYHMPRTDINIFNVPSGCYNAHQCCGGWFGGGNFWTGLGLGLGAGLGNMFMGGLNMLGGWFGGGMNFGFPSFGIPFSSSVSSSSSTRTRGKDELEAQVVPDDDETGVDSKSPVDPDPDAESPKPIDGQGGNETETQAQDLDYTELNNFYVRMNQLPGYDIHDQKSVDVYNAAIDAILNDLNGYTHKDEIMKDKNDAQLEGLKTSLAALKQTYIPEGVSGTGYCLDINGVTTLIDGVDDLKPEVLSAIVTQDDAIGVLVALGELKADRSSPKYDEKPDDISHNYQCGYVTNDARIMQLYAEAGIAVEVMRGSGSSNSLDHWYTGTVSNVKKDSNDTMTFELDCSKNGRYGNRYKVTIEANGDAKIEQINENATTTPIREVKYNPDARILGSGTFTTANR